MSILIVVNNPKDWPLSIPGVRVVSSKDYLSNPDYSDLRAAKVFNLTRSYRYQSTGYYVSLLAEARGHKPMPSISTIQDFKSQTIARLIADDLSDSIKRSLAPIHSNEFVLSIYFGRNMAKRYQRLSLSLFNLFPAPLIRAKFVKVKDWQLQSIRPISAGDIPEEHMQFVMDAATEYFTENRPVRRRRRQTRYDLAILHNPDEPFAPSDEPALRKFTRAAQKLDFDVEMITKDDFGRLGEFDALFIRETTNVMHHTFRFARHAAALGLVVIDDPESILKCTNKVYLAELLARHRIPAPKTLIINKGNFKELAEEMEMPCILKQPDSSFSQGVVKAQDKNEFLRESNRLLDKSDLIIAQEFMPTQFDWRVGILNRQPIYVCKYYMAGSHWQILARDDAGKTREGRAETFAVEDAPRNVVRTALRAANLIGDGLYGVDIKEVNGKAYVIEVNDNPSIDGGVEDRIIKDELYLLIMQTFLTRIEERKRGRRKRR